MDYSTAQIINKRKLTLVNHLPKIGLENVVNEILSGLNCSGKFISSKYFYDKTGSELFEQITLLPEYYPNRTEKSLLKDLAKKMSLNFQGTDIVELGSGDHSKIELILQQIPLSQLKEIIYYPVDISKDAIESAGHYLMEKYPDLQINGLVADFFHQLELIPKSKRRLFCFFGSTIGNFDQDQRAAFLRELDFSMQQEDTFIIGIDMVKDKAVLEAAYNDLQGLTAAFNRNILNSINTICQTDFDPDSFDHLAFYNEELSRIEMHLVAKTDLSVLTPHQKEPILIKRGERIHTENSHKFTETQFNNLLESTNLKIAEIISDDNNWFSIVKINKVN